MIEAKVLLVIEIEEEGEQILILIIQKKSGIIKVKFKKRALDFICKQARIKIPEANELIGKKVMLDADADYSCIYFVIKRKGKMSKLFPIPCEISLVKNKEN